MKPTLSNIERRVQSLEKARPTDEPVIAVRVYDGAAEPDYTMETSSGERPGVQEIRVWWPIYIYDDGSHHRHPSHDDDRAREIAHSAPATTGRAQSRARGFEALILALSALT